MGYIYILTNPSFPDFVKIGYADDVERRLSELNRSKCIPFAFCIYATYEVASRLGDKKVHSIIDKLNPSLRSIDEFRRQKRIREFYEMTPESAYQILEAIAEIHGFEDKLVKYQMTESEQNDAALAEEITERSIERRSPFAFSKCGIDIGAEIISADDPAVICTVVDDKHVSYDGETYALSYLAQKILGWKHLPQGPVHFTYQGEILDDIRRKKKENSKYLSLNSVTDTEKM